jgi:soluble lytic murein transglycosylase
VSGAAILAPLPALSLTESEKQAFTAAFAAAKRGDWTAARVAANAGHDRQLRDALTWLEIIRGNAGLSFADMTGFIAAHPGWPRDKTLHRRAEEAIGTATDSQVESWFKANPPVLPAARLRLASIWMQQGRQADAARLIRQAWIDGSYSAIEEKFMLERYRDVLRGEDNARRLDRLIWDGQYDEAKHMLRHVGPETAALGEARLALAQMAPGVETLIARVPAKLQNDPGLLFERVRWRRHKELDDDAASVLEHPPADLVRPDAWASERLIIARRLLDDGQKPRAYKLAANNNLHEGATFAELEFLAGWIALRDLHQPSTAYNHFVHLYHAVKLPVSLARGAYWAGRAAEAMNQPQQAETWYAQAAPFMTTYYGQLAAAHIGGNIASVAMREPVPTAAESAAFEKNELIQVARGLAQAGDMDDAATFLRRVADDSKAAAAFALVARLARSLNRQDVAVYTAKRASYAGITLMEEGYPIADVPSGGNTEAPLVLAMTRQESAFDVSAVSSAGAMGLMQLMPATASKVAQLLHLPFSRQRLTSDVGYNMKLGHAYLDSLVGDFSGSYVLAIAAYNAGPARVRQWIQEHGDPRAANVDAIDWVERIPFTETRNYVQRVLENLQVYRLRTGKHLPSLSLVADLKR